MNQQNNQQNNTPPPQPPKHFRWQVFLGIPLTVIAFLWFISNIRPSFTFDAIMESMEIVHQAKYARLACFCIICIGIVLAFKTFKKR
jgi:hypothetical protein